MKQIKKLMFKETRKFSLLFIGSLIGIILSAIFLFAYLSTSYVIEDLVITVTSLIAISLITAAIIFFSFSVRSYAAYRQALHYYTQRTQLENSAPDDYEEFELIGYKTYLSTRVLLCVGHSPFVLNRTWVTSCIKDDLFINGTKILLSLGISINTNDRQVKMFFAKEKERDLIYNQLHHALQFQINDQTIEDVTPLYPTQDPFDQSKKTMLNNTKLILGLGLIFTLATVVIVPLVLNLKDTSKESFIPMDTTYEQFEYYLRDINYSGAENISVTKVETDEGSIVLAIQNNNDYAFLGEIEIITDKDVETLSTHWIRPYGIDFYFLESTGNPTDYEITWESYKDLKNPSYLSISTQSSSLSDKFAYDVIFVDNELSIENVGTVSFEQAVFTNLEKRDQLTLYFHDLSESDFINKGVPEDYSTVRYLSEIDAISKTVTVYEVTGQQRQEIVSFTY